MLTEVEQKHFNCIKDFIVLHGYPPTIREVAQVIGYSSHGAVQSALNRLREKRQIDWVEGQARTIRLVGYQVRLIADEVQDAEIPT